MKNIRRNESLKTASSTRISTIPNKHRSTFLDLFMLQNEKDKLDRDCEKINDLLKNNLNRLKEIEEQMTILLKQKEITEAVKPSSSKRSTSDSEEQAKWDTMKLGY